LILQELARYNDQHNLEHQYEDLRKAGPKWGGFKEF
jgi:hypothetical protein